MISVNLKAAADFIPAEQYNEYVEKAYKGLDTVLEGNGPGKGAGGHYSRYKSAEGCPHGDDPGRIRGCGGEVLRTE